MTSADSASEAAAPFPLAKSPIRGYEVTAVDELLERARQTFDESTEVPNPVTSGELRRASFPLKRNGYVPRFVDAALDRLEEVFFERERRRYVAEHGEEAWQSLTRDLKRDILARMSREPGKRFRRRSLFAHGYRRSQVDAVVDQILRAFEAEQPVKTQDIRSVRFHLQRRGYDEAQVDSFLDAVVEYMLATSD